MIELISDIGDRGYPAEFLLSRLRNRKAQYRSLIGRESPEGVRHCLLREYKWIYLRMDAQTRAEFKPFFVYQELRTILSCLRHKAGKGIGAEEALRFSLLSEGIKKILGKEVSARSAVGIIGEALLPVSPEFGRLKRIFAATGVKGVERMLTKIFLEAVVKKRLHPAVRFFFTYTIDARNLINIYKHLRWKTEDHPFFIKGGGLKENELKRVSEDRDNAGLASLAHRLSRAMIQETDLVRIETLLLKGAALFLRQTARDPLSLGVILEYLWNCYIETLDKSITLFGSGLDGDLIEGELII